MSDLSTAPVFITDTQDDILSRFIQNYIAAYQARTGKTIALNPAQGEQLMINAGAYTLNTHKLRVNSAALQNLPQFATYPVLDMLAQPYGVVRIPQQAAQVTALLTLITGHADLVIPAGIRVQSDDGLATFVVQSALAVAAGTNSVSAILLCDTAGKMGNGYVAGKISTVLDPQAYLVSISNTDTSNNGADAETDVAMRVRLFKSAAAKSTAGSEDAYKFYALSASSLISDVAVTGDPDTGIVTIYPLVPGGPTSSEILTAVENACNPEAVRPLTDRVVVVTPTIVNYAIVVNYVAYGSVSDTTALTAQVLAAIQNIAGQNGQLLGIDVIISQLVNTGSLPGVADISALVNGVATNIVIGPTQVGVCTGVVVNLTGFNYDR